MGLRQLTRAGEGFLSRVQSGPQIGGVEVATVGHHAAGFRAGRRLLDHGGDDVVVTHHVEADHTVARDIHVGRERLTSQHREAGFLVDAYELSGETRGAVGHHHDVVRVGHHEGLVADPALHQQEGIAGATHLRLTQEVDVGLGGLDQLQLGRGAFSGEHGLQLHLAIEQVLQGTLAPRGDDQDLGDAGRDQLLDDVGDGRGIDQGEQLLGEGLGGREKPGAVAGGQDDSFSNTIHG